MNFASSVPERLRASLGRRGIATLLALAIEGLLLVLLLWFLAPPLPRKKPIPAIFGFNVEGDDSEASKTERATARPRGKAASKPAATPPVPVQAPVVSEPPASFPPGFIRMTRAEFRAADIAGIKASGGETASNAGAGAANAGDSQAIGQGPHGEPLYAADWYREPTHAELAPYVSSRARGPGWGIVACRTVPGFRVEDCQELGESPSGSGYAGAVRQAAWQFRVRPPRKGGKDLFGTWVRIRIDYTETRSDRPADRASQGPLPPP